MSLDVRKKYLTIRKAREILARFRGRISKTSKPTKNERSIINFIDGTQPDPRKTKDGSFRCTICKKKFGTMFKVIQHARQHHDNGKFKCFLCGIKWAHTRALHQACFQFLKIYPCFCITKSNVKPTKKCPLRQILGKIVLLERRPTGQYENFEMYLSKK